ncbi:hypothetical protein [Streptomyces sp. bgisy082]|uniref:hypothetical protein n=1 Tax=Streptomyces sp. bgisy082 TaxID=3413776 RepID=UPI003D71065F
MQIAAQPVRLDQNRTHADTGGRTGSGTARRTTADDDQIRVVVNGRAGTGRGVGHGPIPAPGTTLPRALRKIEVRALADRGAPRDLIDVSAASRRQSTTDLEEFGRRHVPAASSAKDLRADLAEAEWTDDEAFAAHGLDDAMITALRAWAVEWADGLATRLLEAVDDPDID